MLISDYLLFDIVKCLYAFDLTHFRAWAEIFQFFLFALGEIFSHQNFLLGLIDLFEQIC